MQLEMKYLAHLTGKEVYWRKVEHIMKVLDDHRMQDGLLPIFVHPDTGNFQYQEIRIGSRGDSYYGTCPPFQNAYLGIQKADVFTEYLIKQYLQTCGPEPI